MSRQRNQTALMVIGFTAFSAAPTMAVEQWALPAMKPGPARPWHADVQVSTYSSVNLFHGNMFTAIPIVSWSGTGPDMNFMLYHNSANWNHTAENTKNVGFFLGAGWTISYSDHMIGSTVIYADGTRDTYTWNGTAWVAPTGVYDVLTQDASNPNIWRVTHKDQSFHEFSNWWGDGVKRLVKIEDAVGNATRIEYQQLLLPHSDRIRIWKVFSADRSVEFEYETGGSEPWTRLVRIKDPGETNPPPDNHISIDDRTWTFDYDDSVGGSGWMKSITDPLNPDGNPLTVDGNRNDFTYYTACSVALPDEEPCPPQYTTYLGRLFTVSDKYRPDAPPYETPHNYTHTYIPFAYGLHKALKTTDPIGLEQLFTYTAVSPGYITTKYFDRRNSQWTYKYNNASQNLYPDGNLNSTTDPTGVSYSYYYVNRNLTDIYDNNINSWFRYYDSKGNLTSTEDSLGQSGAWTYDTLNNVTSHTDPLGNVTRYCYEKAGFLTLLTKIIEPDDAMNPTSPVSCSATGYPTTTMDYYTLITDDGKGQLKEIIDPNDVWTGFDYDVWGQQDKYSEGRYDGLITLQNRSLTNSAGFPAEHKWSNKSAEDLLRTLGNEVLAAGGSVVRTKLETQPAVIVFRR